MRRAALLLAVLGAAVLPLRAEEAVTLESCYAEALAKSPAILAAKGALQEAAGAQLVLQARALPSARVGFLAGQQGPRNGAQNPHTRFFILATGNFSQPLYDAAIPASFRRGRVGIALAQQQFNRAVLAELYALRLDFYIAQQARAAVEIQESIKVRLQANLKAQEDQLSVGKVSSREVTQARAQLAALEPGLAASRAAYAQARIDLAQRLGRDLSAAAVEGADPNDPAAGLPVPAGELEPVTASIDYPTETAYALSHRPDLLALRQLIEAAKQDSEIVHAGYMPRIAFQADGQYIPQSSIQKSGTVVQAGNSTELTQVLFGPGYTWVPVDGGAIHGRAQQVDAGRDAYEIDLKRLEQDVPRQLKQVEAGLARAASALQGTEQNIALADRNLRQVEAQVQNGDLPQLDFLNAQSNLLQARFNRLNALLQNNIAIAQYDVITGRTLQFAEAPSPSAP